MKFFYLCFDILQDMSDIRHEKGRLTARQRMTLLFDEGTFEEFSACDYAGVVTGRGKVAGRVVYAYAQDPAVSGGAMSEKMAERICAVMDMAVVGRAPLVALNDSAGAKIQDGVASLGGYGDIFRRNIHASGVIPQVSGIFGPCAGGAVYSPALTDFTVMVRDSSFMFVTGPSVVKTVTGESVSREELGGVSVHSCKSGAVHHSAETEEDAIRWVRDLLSFLPSDNRSPLPLSECQDPSCRRAPELAEIVPENPAKAYDMMQVVRSIVDDGCFFEVQEAWAKNIIVGFARMGGCPVGVVANQPKMLAGVLDINASRKAARFVRFCDAFNIPLLTLVDVPGFLCGTQQESAGIITHGAKLLYAYGEATVPKVTVTLRKSYGGAHITMGCKELGADVNLAWPSANIAVMGVDGAVEILYAKELAAIEDPHLRHEMFLRLRQTYQDEFCDIRSIAQLGHIDEVISPEQTRSKVISALKTIADRSSELPWRKHDNLPL